MKGYRFHIPALFCNDFFSAGFTLMPNLILKYSARLNLSSKDLVVLLAFFFFQQQGKDELSLKDMASLVNMPEKSVKLSIDAMTNRGLFAISRNTCDLSGLFEKITDLWAEEKAQAMQDDACQEAATTSQKISKDMQAPYPHALLQTFEQEFGRALSQMECATILSWCQDKGCAEPIILEALKKAVLRGVLNLTYIDRILTQWSKQNLHTVQEIDKSEEQFLSSRTATSKAKIGPSRETKLKDVDRETRIKDKEEKYKDIYLS